MLSTRSVCQGRKIARTKSEENIKNMIYKLENAKRILTLKRYFGSLGYPGAKRIISSLVTGIITIK